MPPKKKRSRRKKNKGKKKDTDEAKKVWAVNGRKDATGLAKALPATAQRLKSGDINANEAAAQFARLALRETEFRYLPLKIPNDLNYPYDENHTDWVVIVGSHLGRKLFPQSTSRELMDEFNKQLIPTLFLNLEHRCDTAGFRGWTEFYVTVLQTTFDQIAGEWEPRIRRMTGRQLTQTCDIYRVSQEVFLAFVRQFLEEHFDISGLQNDDIREDSEELRNKHEEMLHVMESVARGDDEVRWTCWCCGKYDRETRRCSKCDAARYCSRDCQEKSWKEGHNNVCAELKTVYEGFESDMKRVVKAMEEGVAGIQPTPRFDYMMVPSLLEGEHKLEQMLPSDVFRTLPRPSMDALYRNLTYIINGGDHWLFEDTPNPSFAEDSFLKGGVRPVTKREAADCTTLMTILACDTFGLPEDKLNTFKEKCLDYKQNFDLEGCTWTAELCCRFILHLTVVRLHGVPRNQKQSALSQW